MENNQPTNENLIDPKIYKKATQRVHFKLHLAIYILSMAVLWIIYIFLFKATEPDNMSDMVNGGMTFGKFTILITLLWTVLIVFHCLFVYKLNNTMLEKEVKSLQKEIKKQEELKKALENQKQQQQN